MPTGFHPHAHLHSLGCEIAVELLRFLAVLQSLLSTISRFRIHKSNLLEARVIICSYNDHSPAPFYPSLWLVGTTKVYSGPGSRHCHGIITLEQPTRLSTRADGPRNPMKIS